MTAQIVNAALGIWLMAAPAVLGYEGAACAVDRVVGPVAAACAIIAAHSATRPLRWGNAVLGLGLLLAPWVLRYGWAAAVDSTVVGLLLVTFAALGGRPRQRVGGGWSSLWRTDPPAGGGCEGR
jgi:hypothetical protein